MDNNNQTEEIQQESVIHRVTRLPLICSAFQILSFAYHDVKTVNPVVDFVFDVSERSLKGVSRVAAMGLSPFLNVLEPQIAMVNRAALQVVEQLEVRLPVLDQPADEAISELKDSFVGRVQSFKNRILNRTQNVLNKGQNLLQDIQEAVSLVAVTFGTMGVGELLRLGADLAVTQATDLVDYYLPDEEDKGGEQECGTSEEAKEPERAAPNLLSRCRSLVISIIRRGLKRLNPIPYLDTVWGFLHGAINLLLSFPYKLQGYFQQATRLLLFRPVSNEFQKKTASPKTLKKMNSPKRLVQQSPGRRSSYFKANSSGHLNRVSLQTNAKGKRFSQDVDNEMVQNKSNRIQSLENSLYPSNFLEE